MLQTSRDMRRVPAGISLFQEKPSGDDLANLKAVSKNATEQDPFEVSMGIYVFKRDVLVRKPDTADYYCLLPASAPPCLVLLKLLPLLIPCSGLQSWIPACNA